MTIPTNYLISFVSTRSSVRTYSFIVEVLIQEKDFSLTIVPFQNPLDLPTKVIELSAVQV